MDYQSLEKAVFEHLYSQHQKNPEFTFSVRQTASKGARTDFFIGTSKSKYFSFTLWFIPVYFPGSSADLMNFVIMAGKAKPSIKFQFFQTRSPGDFQNEIDLELGKTLLKKINALELKEYEIRPNDPSHKMEYFDIRPIQNEFDGINTLLEGIDSLVEFISPFVDEEVKKLKAKHSNWEGERLSKEKFDELIEKMKKRQKKYEGYLEGGTADTKSFNENSERKTFPLNQILYGPPGTGKTYHTIDIAADIIGYNSKDHFENREFFNRLLGSQIQFTTFHQSFSYEDFIEGIKPKTDDDGQIKYEIIPGVFKTLCAKAAYEYYRQHKIEIASKNPKVIDFDKFYEEYVRAAEEAINSGQPKKIHTKNGTPLLIKRINRNDSLILATVNSRRKKEAVPKTKRHLLKLYQTFDAVEEIEPVYSIKDVIGIQPGASGYWAVFKDLKEFEKEYLKNSTKESYEEEEEFTDEEIISMFEEGQFTDYIDTEKAVENYVLIIDEINRGNVSQIFGELITLIEDDKRLGKEESLELILPYSKRPFGVPPNLHIIGTMNTADRSVEALDTALRRRFEFREMLPKPELLKTSNTFGRLWDMHQGSGWGEKWQVAEQLFFELYGGNKMTDQQTFQELDDMSWDEWFEAIESGEYVQFNGIDLEELLNVINYRIEKLLDKDHQIGHSYLMKVFSVHELKVVFQNKILPLLQEYFYGDIGRISLIIGEGFFNKKNNEVQFMPSDLSDGSEYDEYQVVQLKDVMEMDNDDFIDLIKKIYQ